MSKIYMPVTFKQINYTEKDREELFQAYQHTRRIGYAQYFEITNNTPDYITRLNSALPIFSNAYTIHRTLQNADTISIPKTHIHIDDRPAALNIPISGCGIGSDTVFYNPTTLRLCNVPAKSGSQIYLYDTVIEDDRFTLTMDNAILLNTQHPHTRIQTTDSDRLFLSMNLCVTYEEALEYFK